MNEVDERTNCTAMMRYNLWHRMKQLPNTRPCVSRLSVEVKPGTLQFWLLHPPKKIKLLSNKSKYLYYNKTRYHNIEDFVCLTWNKSDPKKISGLAIATQVIEWSVKNQKMSWSEAMSLVKAEFLMSKTEEHFPQHSNHHNMPLVDAAKFNHFLN